MLIDLGGIIFGIDEGEDTVTLNIIKDFQPYHRGSRRHDEHTSREIKPVHAGGKHHADKHQDENEGGAHVAGGDDKQYGDRRVSAEKKDIFQAGNIVFDLAQMKGKGDDKADFDDLRGLEIKAADSVPGESVASSVGGDAEEKEHDHQQYAGAGNDRPELENDVIVDERDHQSGEKAQAHGENHNRRVTGEQIAGAVIFESGATDHDHAENRKGEGDENENDIRFTNDFFYIFPQQVYHVL